jgi:ATP-dependent protease ClpP protease subunit
VSEDERLVEKFRTQDEINAGVRKLLAEAALIEEQLLKAQADTQIAQLVRDGAGIAAEREKQQWAVAQATDNESRIFRFVGEINTENALYVMGAMDRWSRLDVGVAPNRPYTLQLTSPGGDIMTGLALYDYLKVMDRVHPVTVLAAGLCASMATVIVQAGSTRVSYPSTSWLIHRAAWGAAGREDEMEDQRKYVELMQERVLDILGASSNIGKAELKKRSARREWWFLGDEALKIGLVDSIAC